MWWASSAAQTAQPYAQNQPYRGMMSSEDLSSLLASTWHHCGSCISPGAERLGGEHEQQDLRLKAPSASGIPRVPITTFRDYIAILASATLKRDHSLADLGDGCNSTNVSIYLRVQICGSLVGRAPDSFDRLPGYQTRC